MIKSIALSTDARFTSLTEKLVEGDATEAGLIKFAEPILDNGI